MFYIYKLTDPRDGIIRYVGYTKNPKQRLRGHISTQGNPKRSLTAKWIYDLRDAGLSPVMDIIEQGENIHPRQRESYWTYTYLAQGIPLLNDLKYIMHPKYIMHSEH